MTLETRLTKLEAKRKAILRCLWCQYSLRPLLPKEIKADFDGTGELLAGKCWFCGTSFNVFLAGKDKYEREVTSIVCTSHPSRRFTEERVHTAFIYYRQLLEIQKHVSAMAGRSVSNRSHQPSSAKPGTGFSTPTAERRKREREELERKAIEFRRTAIERIRLVAKGPESFPIDQAISQIQEECHMWRFTIGFTEMLGLDMNDQSRFDLEETIDPLVSYLRARKTQGVCSMVLWGIIPGEILSEIKSAEQQIQTEFDKAVKEGQEKAKREEEERCEALERARRAREETQRIESAQFEAEVQARRAELSRTKSGSTDRQNVPHATLSEEAQMQRIAHQMKSMLAKPQSTVPTGVQRYLRPNAVDSSVIQPRFCRPLRDRYRPRK
jgi:hypothetical protein